MSARRFLVQGRVQGVGYRYFVSREAHALAVAGWVRNLSDGRVEVVASGEDTVLEILAGRLWEGPPLARVSNIEASDADAPETAGFRVLPTPW
jgi:acylphosphatase